MDFPDAGTYRSLNGTVAAMIDLNDLRIFERVAALRSFSAASRALGMPKSSVSRSIQRLETALANPLLQRTTRDVTLTEAGLALRERCATLLGDLDETLQYIGSLRDKPRGRLRVSAGIGFSINVLAALLPRFALQYPEIDIALELGSEQVDLVGDQFDIAIRMGPMPDSTVLAKRLGVLRRYVCAAPDYLARRGIPTSFAELDGHDLLDFPVPNGRRPSWPFAKDGETEAYRVTPRFSVNCALTIHRMILNGAGIGLSSGYLCGPEIKAGRLVRLFPDWTLPAVPVHAVFPGHRERSPMVRALIDFMIEQSSQGHDWQADPLA